MNSVSWMRILARTPRIDRRLQRRQRVPLTRAFTDANLRALLLQRVEQALEGLGERLHALDLELARHLVEVDARLRELLQLPLREVDVLVQADEEARHAGDFAEIAAIPMQLLEA